MAKKLNNTGKLILATEGRSRYDTESINLIVNRKLLAWILQECVEEFAGMSLEEIMPYIDDLSIGSLPVEPGLTNTTTVGALSERSSSERVVGAPTDRKISERIVGAPTDCKISERIVGAPTDRKISERIVGAPTDRKISERIVGLPTESKIPGEGVITYDIRFSARNPHPKGPSNRLQFDLELQNKDKPGYDIETRAAFNCGRMLSDQMGQTITGKNYKGLNKVCSIWICISTPLKRANTIYRTRLISEALSGSKEEAQCIFIRLPDENRKTKPENKPTELMTVLSALFSEKKSAAEKMTIFQEHGIEVTTEEEERINIMCNLSEAIYNNGRRDEHKETLKEKRRADAAEKRADAISKQLDDANKLIRELKLQLAAST